MSQVSSAVPGIMLDQALRQVSNSLESDPQAALDQAELLLRTARAPRVLRLAAAACRKLGLADDAVDAELAAIQAGTSDTELRRAAIAQNEGNPEDALAIAEAFLQKEPHDLLALTIVAEAA